MKVKPKASMQPATTGPYKQPITIFIKFLGGGDLRMSTSPDATIASLMAAISKKENIPVHEQNLIFEGCRLSPYLGKTLQDCGVTHETTLYLALNMSGNGHPEPLLIISCVENFMAPNSQVCVTVGDISCCLKGDVAESLIISRTRDGVSSSLISDLIITEAEGGGVRSDETHYIWKNERGELQPGDRVTFGFNFSSDYSCPCQSILHPKSFLVYPPSYKVGEPEPLLPLAASLPPVLTLPPDYLVNPLESLTNHGYFVITLNEQIGKTIESLYAQMVSYFPDEIPSLLPSDAKSVYQIPSGYSLSREKHKQFYVVREGESLPKNLSWSRIAFKELGTIARGIAMIILTSLGCDCEMAADLLVNSLSKAESYFTVPFTSCIELFQYNYSDFGLNHCEAHTDASVLTIIPKSLGLAGLEVKNPKTGVWHSVESGLGPNQCIVFAGDMLHRLTNNLIAPTQHRVNIAQKSPITSKRYSCPFELMLDPKIMIDCSRLFPAMDIVPSCSAIESSMSCMSEFSRDRVSVNKTT